MMSRSSLQKRLEEAFTNGGIVGGELLPVLNGERACGESIINKFHWQMVLGDSFQAFFIETLKIAEGNYRASPLFQTLRWYPYLLLLQLANFRTIRAGEILFVGGRPVQGYGLLRDLKDRAVILGAVGNGFTTVAESSGLAAAAGAKDFLGSVKELKNKRKKTEAEAIAKMIGTKSPLSEAACINLRKWEEFFHLEVHGARVTSLLEDEEWMKQGGLYGFQLVRMRNPATSADGLDAISFESIPHVADFFEQRVVVAIDAVAEVVILDPKP